MYDIDNDAISGIIGYVTPQTTTISQPGDKIKFLDEIQSIKHEVAKLKKDGVKILIALGHSGYFMDKKIAAEVEGLDLVVGGHSHTFLFTNKKGHSLPDIDEPQGDYPTYIKQKDSDRIVPVVQVTRKPMLFKSFVYYFL